MDLFEDDFFAPTPGAGVPAPHSEIFRFTYCQGAGMCYKANYIGVAVATLVTRAEREKRL